MTTLQPTINEDRIKVADMQKDMIIQAMKVAQQALARYQIYQDVAQYIKQHFDKKYYPTWHCLVGKNFSTIVTYQSRHYIHFEIAEISIMLFKFG